MTTYEDAQAILLADGLTLEEDLYSYTSGIGGVVSTDLPANILYPDASTIRLGLTLHKNLVVAMSIPVAVCVSTVINTYGEPDFINGVFGAPGDNLELVYMTDVGFLSFAVGAPVRGSIVWVYILDGGYTLIPEATWDEVKDVHLDESCEDGFTQQ